MMTIPNPMVPTSPPEPKKPSPSGEGFPPLVLPPEGSGSPSGVVPPTTVRSSPLNGGTKPQIFPAEGELAADGLRKIGFFNHTDRDINLTIDGKKVTLPQKSYIHARVGATFRWSHADNPVTTTTVPGGAAGLEVLFRESTTSP
jgi:hypothetical protein